MAARSGCKASGLSAPVRTGKETSEPEKQETLRQGPEPRSLLQAESGTKATGAAGKAGCHRIRFEHPEKFESRKKPRPRLPAYCDPGLHDLFHGPGTEAIIARLMGECATEEVRPIVSLFSPQSGGGRWATNVPKTAPQVQVPSKHPPTRSFTELLNSPRAQKPPTAITEKTMPAETLPARPALLKTVAVRESIARRDGSTEKSKKISAAGAPLRQIHNRSPRRVLPSVPNNLRQRSPYRSPFLPGRRRHCLRPRLNSRSQSWWQG